MSFFGLCLAASRPPGCSQAASYSPVEVDACGRVVKGGHRQRPPTLSQRIVQHPDRHGTYHSADPVASEGDRNTKAIHESPWSVLGCKKSGRLVSPASLHVHAHVGEQCGLDVKDLWSCKTPFFPIGVYPYRTAPLPDPRWQEATLRAWPGRPACGRRGRDGGYPSCRPVGRARAGSTAVRSRRW